MRLLQWMEDHPVEALQIRMRRLGMQSFELLTIRLITQQERLLEEYRLHGQQKAGASALRFGTSALLDDYASRIIPLPCNYDPQQDVEGSTAAGMGRLPALSPETTVISSLLFILLLSGAGLLLAQQLARRHRRRQYRHPCSLPCNLLSGQTLLQAKLVDISQMGAKVRVWNNQEKTLSTLSGDLTAALPGIGSAGAQITWKNANYLGLKFTTPLTGEELQTLLAWPPAKQLQQTQAVKPA
ncbi:PilZ domain-containing protein [Leisingera sp.]|uniref:PilZ domain-containing protein n=1 Tax=Leisingera sp. TaxID=1879318 RepID=UPI002B269370|nr:PilZ domain-containing protein [Leisingera sp.]